MNFDMGTGGGPVRDSHTLYTINSGEINPFDGAVAVQIESVRETSN